MFNLNTVVVMLHVVLLLIFSVPFYMELAPVQSDVPDDVDIDVPFGEGTLLIPEHEHNVPQIRFSLPLSLYRLTEPDDHIRSLAEGLRSTCHGDDHTLLCIVNDYVYGSISYMTDEEAHGMAEYWQTPCETLARGTGDCEDHAILFVSICKALGYECVMVVGPGHMSAGVLLDENGEKVSYGGKEYLTFDPTRGYLPGEVSPEVWFILSDGFGKEQAVGYVLLAVFMVGTTVFMRRVIG